jgi:transcriptional regulator with XRE-family HTH domain
MSVTLIVIIINIANNLKMDKEYLQKFANNLRKIRKLKGIKQDDFLEIEGISRSTIAMIEIAKTDVTLSKIKIIADVLKVEPKDLLDFK